MGGEMPQMLEAGRRVVETAEQSEDWLYVYVGHGIQAWAESRLGQHQAALESLSKARAVDQGFGEELIAADWFAAGTAEMVLAAGRVQEAAGLAEQAVAFARSFGGIFAEALAQRVWGQAFAQWNPSRGDEAEAHLAESLRLFEAGEARLEAARTHVSWGQVLRDRGSTEAAREHFERAAAQFKVSGLESELHETHSMSGEAPANGADQPGSELVSG